MYNYWSHFKMRSRDLINLLKPLAIIKMKKKIIFCKQSCACEKQFRGDFVMFFPIGVSRRNSPFAKSKTKLQPAMADFVTCFSGQGSISPFVYFNTGTPVFTAVCFDSFSEFSDAHNHINHDAIGANIVSYSSL